MQSDHWTIPRMWCFWEGISNFFTTLTCSRKQLFYWTWIIIPMYRTALGQTLYVVWTRKDTCLYSNGRGCPSNCLVGVAWILNNSNNHNSENILISSMHQNQYVGYQNTWFIEHESYLNDKTCHLDSCTNWNSLDRQAQASSLSSYNAIVWGNA